AETLCRASPYAGWDADGGYAEYMTVPAAYAHRLPPGYTDEELAPLLCAGIIGYRALKRAELPRNGRLGIYGFGGSAHLAAQVALARGATVHVLTRGEQAKRLALELGAASVGAAAGGAAGARDPVRPGRRPGAARPGRAGPWRHPGDRGHPPDRHPAAQLREAPVPGAAAAQRHLQHPGGRPRVPRPSGQPQAED